jgi:hypothetical protein
MTRTRFRHSRIHAGLATLLLGVISCAASAQPVADPDAAREWQYRAGPGDTLIRIAAMYLIDPGGWRRLQLHNQIEDPRRLNTGQVVRIPYELLRREPIVADVIFVQGDASVRRQGSAATEPVQAGAVVRVADLLRTGPQSSMTLRFADGSRLLISPDSELLVERLLVYGRSAIVSTGVRLQRGGIDAQVQPTRGTAPTFEVRTPAINLGVRGTEFRARVGGDGGKSITEVLEGQVAAGSQAVAVADPLLINGGYGTLALPQQPVAPPRLLLPAPVVPPTATTLATAPLFLSWQPVDNAAAYRVQIFADADAGALLFDAQLARPPAQLPQQPRLADGGYLLRVRAIDAAGIEGLNANVALTVAVQPSAPRSELPREGAVIGGDTVNLRWDLQPEVLRYRLQVASERSFSDVLRDRIIVGNDTAIALPPGVYHWRVASMNGGAAEASQRNGPFGPAQVFELRAMPPLPELEPVQFSPRNLLLRWRPTAAGQGLQIQLASDPQFEKIVFDQRTWGAQMQIPRPSAGRLYMRMRSWIGDDSAGEFGQPQILDVPGVLFWERW